MVTRFLVTQKCILISSGTLGTSLEQMPDNFSMGITFVQYNLHNTACGGEITSFSMTQNMTRHGKTSL